MKPKVLYLCVNDGSDPRITKEIQTLASRADVVYCGIGRSVGQSYAQAHCAEWHVTKGYHNSPLVFARYYLSVLRVFFKQRYHSIHVINENLLILFIPMLVFAKARIVLDIFDSIFLRGYQGRFGWLQRLCYRMCAAILVTDENRLRLQPPGFEAKTYTLENYPWRVTERYPKAAQPGELIVFYSGAMNAFRGTEILQEMLKVAPGLRIWMAGWVYDDATRELAKHPQVQFFGTVSQAESLRLAAQADYILALYEPINANNINASPNKIYDAIQARTPVIINGEVLVSAWVRKQNVGYVIESFYQRNFNALYHDLVAQKDTFTFTEGLASTYTWDAVETKLLQAHAL